MIRIGIHSHYLKHEWKEYIKQIIDFVSPKVDEIFLTPSAYSYFEENKLPESCFVLRNDQECKKLNYMLSVGGDGTLLETITIVKDSEVPILGINAGRLGFLATTSIDEICTSLAALLNGYYTIENRSLIKLVADKDLFQGINFAMNEFAILKRDTSSMIVVHTYINGEYLNSYWADGLLVSTPTGSTGYSLSVGGPVMMPDSNSFIISPVSPHNLSVRPLIVPDTSVISFEIEGRSKNFLVSLDSRSRTVEASIRMAVSKCNFSAKLINLNGKNFFNTLRQKLNWGIDSRN